MDSCNNEIVFNPKNAEAKTQDETEILNATIRESEVAANYLELRCGIFFKKSLNKMQIEKLKTFEKKKDVDDIPFLEVCDIEALWGLCKLKAFNAFSRRYPTNAFEETDAEIMAKWKIYHALTGMREQVRRLQKNLSELDKGEPACRPLIGEIRALIRTLDAEEQERFDFGKVSLLVINLIGHIRLKKLKRKFEGYLKVIGQKTILFEQRASLYEQIRPSGKARGGAFELNPIERAMAFRKPLLGIFVPDIFIEDFRIRADKGKGESDAKNMSGENGKPIYHVVVEINGGCHDRKSQKDAAIAKFLAKYNVHVMVIENETAFDGNKIVRDFSRMQKRGNLHFEKSEAGRRSLLRLKVRTIACWLSFEEIDQYYQEKYGKKFFAKDFFEEMIAMEEPPHSLRNLKRKLKSGSIIVPEKRSVWDITNGGFWRQYGTKRSIKKAKTGKHKAVILRRKNIKIQDVKCLHEV